MNILDWARSPTVLVPIVRKGDTKVDWLDVYSRPATPPERDKAEHLKQDVAIVPLARKQMLKTAIAGLEAVKRLLGRRGMRAGELNTRLGEVCVDTDRVLPSLVEDRSSDLGIGLALLLGVMADQNNVGVLAATGQLGTFGTALNDLPVEPVGGTEAKLAALLALKQQGGGVADALTLVFTPKETDTGTPVMELDVVAKLGQLPGVQVHPVGSFGEAARILGIRPRFPWPTVFRAVGSVLAAGLLVAMTVSAARFLTRPATLEWQAGDVGLLPDPYLVCLDERRIPVRPHPVGSAGALPGVPSKGVLAWNARTGQSDEAEHWLSRMLQTFGYDTRYHLAVVLVGNATGLGAVNQPVHSKYDTGPARSNPGAVWAHFIAMEGAPERRLLVVLANRFQDFDQAALRRLESELQAEIARERGPDGVDLDKVKLFLETKADVSLSFKFQAEGQDPVCSGG